MNLQQNQITFSLNVLTSFLLSLPCIMIKSLLISIPVLLAGNAAVAHDLVSLNGQGQSHQHVARSGAFGSNPQSGHYAKPPGSKGILIWSPSTRSNYGKAQPGMQIPNGFQQHGKPVVNLQQQFEAEARQDSFGNRGD